MSFQDPSVLDRDPRHTVAGLSMKGGQKENFFLCLIQYFPQYSRWSLTKLSQMRDYPVGGDNTLKAWVREHDLRHLVLDFALSEPACLSCKLECPGTDLCHEPKIQKIRQEIEGYLEEDAALHDKNPKEYERKRLEMEKVFGSKLDRPSEVLSKSFKRRLKKGITPYWHRGVDLWVWKEYYDLFLSFFKTSYDSLGGSSLMLTNRFEYLKRHLPQSVSLWESDTRLILLELLLSQSIKERYLRGLGQLDEAHLSRKAIIKNIEQNFNLFIYERDQELLETEPKAFDSFLLALAGVFRQQSQLRKLPDWAFGQDNFIIPSPEKI